MALAISAQYKVSRKWPPTTLIGNVTKVRIPRAHCVEIICVWNKYRLQQQATRKPTLAHIAILLFMPHPVTARSNDPPNGLRFQAQSLQWTPLPAHAREPAGRSYFR